MRARSTSSDPCMKRSQRSRDDVFTERFLIRSTAASTLAGFRQHSCWISSNVPRFCEIPESRHTDGVNDAGDANRFLRGDVCGQPG
jgi:hypothetical protein